ncbi:MAG: hypothetical protein EPN21_18060 [Methylococcaceae bacterium]|nr:MAG: hypothetical protein EPN21_18060 [Methylococcaceae bacterium]
MSMKLYLLSLLVFCIGFLWGTGVYADPLHPFPQHVAYAAATIKPDHRTQAQLDADVQAFYDQWKKSYVISAGISPAGNPLYRISYGSTDPGRTVSEGQGYGMVIVATMAGYDTDAQTIFDGLREFARLYPSSINARLMSWEVPPGNADSAFDGDADMAYGLLLAHAQWGSAGRIGYAAEANTLISAIKESTIGPVSHLPLLGDWVEPDGKRYNQYTPRSSDFILNAFRTYGRATNDAAWDSVVAGTQKTIGRIQARYSPRTGLLPDFIVFQNRQPKPAPRRFLEGVNDGAYNYNAGRVPWRLATDALLNNDPVSMAQAQKISHWIQAAAKNNPANIRAGYRLNGSPLPGSRYFTTFFVAPFGVAAMTDPDQQAWLNKIYDAVFDVHEDYYEDSVTLLSLLVMTGNYWDPVPQ